MTQSVKKILTANFFIEISFIGLFVFYLSFSPLGAKMLNIYNSGTVVGARAAELKSLIRNYGAKVFFINKTKQVHIQYFGKEIVLQTGAKTFGELSLSLPFNIEKEYLDDLASLKILNNMEIIIPPNQYQIGMASWYGRYFQGRPTASAEPYDMHALTAAHKTLPLGARVKKTRFF